MTLKGKKPEFVKPSKPKILLSGPAGWGKSMWALQFPKVHFTDAEKGGNRDQYVRALQKSGGWYFGEDDGSQDFFTVIDEVKKLATEKHEYKTSVIDSVSHLYMLEAAKAEEEIGNEFSKDKKEANRPSRRLLRYIDHLDLNVILIAHDKGKWARKGKQLFQDGTTFDFYDKAEFILDLWLEVVKSPTKDNEWQDGILLVRKTRVESLPLGLTFPMTYEAFANLYGKELMEADVMPIKLANEEQLKKIKELIDVLNVPQEIIKKWFDKCNVDSFEEMTDKQIDSLTENLTEKIKKIKGDK